jgi:adenylate isopentenyltransferase (cytokinin synthase)
MVHTGLIEELKEYFDIMSIHKTRNHTRLDKAISVLELREYFLGRRSLFYSIYEMKANTKALAKEQTAKTHHIAGVWGSSVS